MSPLAIRRPRPRSVRGSAPPAGASGAVPLPFREVANMGRCNYKLLSSPAVLFRPTELRPPRLGCARLLGDNDFRGASASHVLPSPANCPMVAVLAPMADAEDGELPPLGFQAWRLDDPREDMDL